MNATVDSLTVISSFSLEDRLQKEKGRKSLGGKTDFKRGLISASLASVLVYDIDPLLFLRGRQGSFIIYCTFFFVAFWSHFFYSYKIM